MFWSESVLKVVCYIQFILHFCKCVRMASVTLHLKWIREATAAGGAIIPDVSNRRPVDWIATARMRPTDILEATQSRKA